MSFSDAVREHPELVKKYLGSVVPYTDNFFATLNSAVFSDGSFVYIPKGVRCPMELSTYFRINAKDTGQFERTLIIAEEGALRQLPRGLHGADARREPAPRRGRRARRARRRDDQVLDDSELVPRRQGRQGRDLQLRDQARPVRRTRLEDHLDPGRDGLGHHLEVSELHPAGRQLDRRVLLRRDHEQLAAGGHRHEDDPPREEHAQHDRLEGHFRRPRPEHLPRAGAHRQERQARAQLLAVRLAAHRRQVRRAHVPVSRDPEQHRPRSSTKRRRRRSARTRFSTAGSAGSRRRTPST